MKALFLIGIAGTGALAATSLFASDTPENTGDPYNPNPYGGGPVSPNLNAWLETIMEGESNGDFFALVGGGKFTDNTDHPANTGEFSGIHRADGRLTTAAGAFQITQSTWNDLGGKNHYGSFDENAQRQAAIDLIQRRGAMPFIESGNVTQVINRLRNEWEFLQKWDGVRVVSTYLGYGGKA